MPIDSAPATSVIPAIPARLHSYVDGKSRPASSGEASTVFNPANGEPLCEADLSSPADVDAAVQAARRAFPDWSRRRPAERGRLLLEVARRLRAALESLAALEVVDTGKPIAEARAVDLPSGAEALEYYAGLAAGLHGEHFDLGGSFAYTRREPLGVCAGIGAWNYPLQMACWKSAPALACGNTMVFKPSELTPLSALRLAEIFSEAGVPDGVFNVVLGAGPTGQALSRHPGVAKVSFTGQVTTGRRVMADAAGTLKHVTMELGGKSPLILFPDCHLDNAVSAALLANFFTQGEVCCNGTRVFLHESIYESFLERLLPRVRAIRVGDPMDPATQMGALISQAHRDKVRGYVEGGERDGAALLCGGAIPQFGAAQARLRDGYYLTPAVFAGCRDEMALVREEIFGPVMAVLRFSGEEEVIARANDTDFGLAAGVFTRDVQRAHRVAASLQAGTIWINNYNLTPVEVPFGGVKQSGIGRENSLVTLSHYTQLKSVYVEMGDVESPY